MRTSPESRGGSLGGVGATPAGSPLSFAERFERERGVPLDVVLRDRHRQYSLETARILAEKRGGIAGRNFRSLVIDEEPFRLDVTRSFSPTADPSEDIPTVKIQAIRDYSGAALVTAAVAALLGLALWVWL